MTIVSTAKLDANRIYWGMQDKALNDLTEGDVVFYSESFGHADVAGVTFLEGGCDLPVGRYAWNAEHNRFEPVDARAVRDTPTIPLADRALYELVIALDAADMPVPQYSREWANHFARTWDMG